MSLLLRSQYSFLFQICPPLSEQRAGLKRVEEGKERQARELEEKIKQNEQKEKERQEKLQQQETVCLASC